MLRRFPDRGGFGLCKWSGQNPSKNRRLGRRLAVVTVLAGKPCDMLDNAASVLGSAEDQQKPAEAHIKDLHAKIGPLTLGNDFLARVPGRQTRYDESNG